MNDNVTISELAQKAGLTTSAVTRQCRLGQIAAQRFGNQWIITRADAEAFLKKLPLPVGWPAQKRNAQHA